MIQQNSKMQHQNYWTNSWIKVYYNNHWDRQNKTMKNSSKNQNKKISKFHKIKWKNMNNN